MRSKEPKRPTEPKNFLMTPKHVVTAVPPGVTPYTLDLEENEPWKDWKENIILYPSQRHGYVYLSTVDGSIAMRSVAARALGKALMNAADYMDGIK